MFFGLLLVLLGLFLMLWGLHYFGVLVAVGGNDSDTSGASFSGGTSSEGSTAA